MLGEVYFSSPKGKIEIDQANGRCDMSNLGTGNADPWPNQQDLRVIGTDTHTQANRDEEPVPKSSNSDLKEGLWSKAGNLETMGPNKGGNEAVPTGISSGHKPVLTEVKRVAGKSGTSSPHLDLLPAKDRFQPGNFGKLKPRVDGPFKIIEKIGENAYKLQFPDEYEISPMFNVKDLRAYHGEDLRASLFSQLWGIDAGASINTPNIGNSALIIEELDWGGQDALNTCENSFFGPHLGLGRQKNVIRLRQTPDVELPY